MITERFYGDAREPPPIQNGIDGDDVAEDELLEWRRGEAPARGGGEEGAPLGGGPHRVEGLGWRLQIERRSSPTILSTTAVPSTAHDEGSPNVMKKKP
jgi:hypothetical protein